MRRFSRATATALAASMMALVSASPSSAFATYHRGGFHGGFGGFYGGMGGFHGGFGGFHPSFYSGFAGLHPGFHPFFGGRRAFFFHHHRVFPNTVFVNGTVVGGGWWGGWGGCWSYRPVYDASGVYLGYSYVYICY